MTDKPTYRRLPDDECISEEMMYRYIDGQLNSADMHRVEAHTLECGLCADALEGLEKVKERDRKGGYFRLPGTGGAAETGGKVVSLFSRPAFYYSAAACVLLLVGFFTLRNVIFDNASPESHNIAEASKTNRFVPDKDGDQRAADSISLPDNTKIAVHDLEENLKNDSVNNSRIQKMPAEHDVTATDRSMDNTEGSGSFDGNSADIPKQTASDDQLSNSNVYRNDHFATNSENLNTVTQTATTVDIKKNKNTKDESNRASNAPSAASGSVVNTKAVAMEDSQVSSNSETVNNDVADEAISAGATNTSGMIMQAEDSTTAVTTQQAQPNLHPNQETDADVDLSYDAGLKMLAQNNPQGSLIFFDDVIAHPSNSHYQDAEWKKAGALIQLGKKDDAKTLLNKIVSEGGKYKTQAEEKLKTL